MRILAVFSALACFGCSELMDSRAKAYSSAEVIEVEEVAPAATAVVSQPAISPPKQSKFLTIPESDRNRRAAVLIARIAINENTNPLRPLRLKGTAGKPTSDHKALIQEMVEFARWKGVSLRRAARWQSKYITGVKKAKVGHQHAWTSTLPGRGKARPSGWIECPKPRPKDFLCHGTWKTYANNWATFRDWVIAEITGGEITRECSGRPITWGGDMDDHIALSRGLCVLDDCGENNTYWTFPGWGCVEPLRDTLKRKGIRKGSIPARVIVKGWREKAQKKLTNQ